MWFCPVLDNTILIKKCFVFLSLCVNSPLSQKTQGVPYHRVGTRTYSRIRVLSTMLSILYIYLSIYDSIYLSLYLSIYLFILVSTQSPMMLFCKINPFCILPSFSVLHIFFTKLFCFVCSF